MSELLYISSDNNKNGIFTESWILLPLTDIAKVHFLFILTFLFVKIPMKSLSWGFTPPFNNQGHIGISPQYLSLVGVKLNTKMTTSNWMLN